MINQQGKNQDHIVVKASTHDRLDWFVAC